MPLLVLFRHLLISCVGAEDGATQSVPEFNNDSPGDDSSNIDEASQLLSEEDARLSTDGFLRPRRPTIGGSEWVIEEKTPPPATDSAPKALDNEFFKLGLGSSKIKSLGSSKKSKKKSRIDTTWDSLE